MSTNKLPDFATVVEHVQRVFNLTVAQESNAQHAVVLYVPQVNHKLQLQVFRNGAGEHRIRVYWLSADVDGVQLRIGIPDEVPYNDLVLAHARNAVGVAIAAFEEDYALALRRHQRAAERLYKFENNVELFEPSIKTAFECESIQEGLTYRSYHNERENVVVTVNDAGANVYVDCVWVRSPINLAKILRILQEEVNGGE